MAPEIEGETTVNESYSVTVPAAVRQEADVDVGDKLRAGTSTQTGRSRSNS